MDAYVAPMGVEPTRPYGQQILSLSRLPVPPRSQIVGKVGFGPTRLSALVPKTSASTIPPLTHICGGRRARFPDHEGPNGFQDRAVIPLRFTLQKKSYNRQVSAIRYNLALKTKNCFYHIYFNSFSPICQRTNFCRVERTRTFDPLVPNQVRYQLRHYPFNTM